MERFDDGAEAVIYLDAGCIVKDRVCKIYRHPVLDLSLRRFRMRREAKVLTELEKHKFHSPHLIKMDKDLMQIRMEHIHGAKLRDIFETNPVGFGIQIGKRLGQLHLAGIIHADLTTSNMILKDEIYLIDFGLSFFSDKIEDKAVDLHLLKQALESKHPRTWKESFDAVIDSYLKMDSGNQAVIKRLEIVEKRGRYKNKGS